MPTLINTDYALKLFFPNPTFAQIYYEAIANALDAKATEVTINILTTSADITQKDLEITISDNGEGFTNERFQRFKESQESDAYHKGLGRLVYLHYFSQVNVESVYGEKKRTFKYSKEFKGDSKVVDVSPRDQQGTTLRFSGFLGDRLKSFEDVKPSALKLKIREHFLPYLDKLKEDKVRFNITIDLETVGPGSNEVLSPEIQSITPADIPEFISKLIHDDHLSTVSDITMRYILEKDSGHRTLITAVSIDGRTIPTKLLERSALPVTSSAIFLFESDLFGKADTARQRWTVPDGIDVKELTHVLRREIGTVLSETFEEVERRNTETRDFFEERYPHLTGYFEQTTVGIIDKDDALWSAERRFFHEQRQILECTKLDDAKFEKSLELSSRSLAEYVLYRELIIKRFREITEKDAEDAVHSLIVPRWETFHGDKLLDGIYQNNAWLLDDKFMSFRTILSEGTMQELISFITEGENVDEKGRPDISMIFSGDPNEGKKVEVVVVEVKPKRISDKENTFASVQLAQRARKLAAHCPNIQRVWYFGIINIDPELSEVLQVMNWTPLFSKGQAFYTEHTVKRPDGTVVRVPTCLLSHDTVIEDAAARNHTFLEILKSDIKKAEAKGNGQIN